MPQTRRNFIMPLTIINAQLGRSKKFLKKCAPQRIIKEKVKETALKKIIPTTMIVAESLGSFAGHAQNINKTLLAYNGLYDTKNITQYVPFLPKIKNEDIFPPLGSFDFLPRNNFKKNSECLREPYNGTPELLDYFIENLIPKRKGKKDYNPFYQKGKSFIEIGKKYNINPAVLVAIGMQESARGTSYAAIRKNNIGGITLKKGHAEFKTVEECIESMAEVIDKRLKENYNSIEAIGKSGKYCDKSASDLWIKNVMFFLNKM